MPHKERNCNGCEHFNPDGGKTDRGYCALGERGGVTYGRYICGRFKARFFIIIDDPRNSAGVENTSYEASSENTAIARTIDARTNGNFAYGSRNNIDKGNNSGHIGSVQANGRPLPVISKNSRIDAKSNNGVKVTRREIE